MLIKKYDDSDNYVEYDYDTANRLSKRTWMRDSRSIDTIYCYTSNTGLLLGVYYDDYTQDVTYSYDRLGRRTMVNDGVIGQHTFAYRDSDLQLDTETIDGSSGGLYSKMITWSYDTTTGTGTKGRRSGFYIGSQPSPEYEVTYGYDDYGRLNSVKGPGLPDYGVEYSYVTDGDLIDSYDYMSDSTTAEATVDYTYVYQQQGGADRDFVAVVENKAGDPLAQVSKYSYVYDDLNRRASVVNEGSAFSQDELNNYTYNDRSELTLSKRHAGTDPGSPGTEETDERRNYSLDNIGNWDSFTKAGGTATSFTINNLNQYTASTDPTESFSYDLDGNFTDDAEYKYVWNDENRLVEVATRVELGSNPSAYDSGDKKLEFVYDYMGRRVQKVYSTYNGSSWVEQEDLVFVYDGWNVVLVLNNNSSDAVLKKYTWGLDKSRTLDKAGGIGGLLAAYETQGTTTTADDKKYWYFYDANGNVGQLIDGSDYSTDAKYEYDPYGNKIVADGFYADNNPFRFSTKWLDKELAAAGQKGAIGDTGMYYYGIRYLGPRIGRWMSRDPVAEQGGLNLYGFVNNNPNNSIDILGLYNADVHEVLTARLAQELGMRGEATNLVGAEDIATDGQPPYYGGETGPGPTGDQSRHFNKNPYGLDSRIEHRYDELMEAKRSCSQNSDDPETAARHLGRSLHSTQDWWAHGDFGKGVHGTYSYHGPQIGVDPGYDDINRDAVGTQNGVSAYPNGRPPQVLGYVSEDYWRNFQTGTNRKDGVIRSTKADLLDFLDHVRSTNSIPKCKCFFLSTY